MDKKEHEGQSVKTKTPNTINLGHGHDIVAKTRSMRQPKYRMGERVIIPIVVSNDSVGFNTKLEVDGTVVGVHYDLYGGGGEHPYYIYAVMPDGAKYNHPISEHEIKNER